MEKMRNAVRELWDKAVWDKAGDRLGTSVKRLLEGWAKSRRKLRTGKGWGREGCEQLPVGSTTGEGWRDFYYFFGADGWAKARKRFEECFEIAGR